MSNGNGVPLFDLVLQYQGLRKGMEEAVNRVLNSGRYVLGEEVTKLEEELARYCGAATSVACGSGTDAISLALAAMDVGPGDEVIVPPFTFFATASCVVRLGAKPIFVDVEPDTFNVNPRLVEAAITDRTKAIMPVHLFGQCCDMGALWQISERHNVPLIEDAAQSLGSDYEGKRCGTLGAMACMSFYPTKNIGAYGDAGAVVTNDQEYAEKLRILRVHGMEPRYYHKYLGWNARIDALQAAILRVKLPWLDRWLDARQAIARRYDDLLEEQQLGHLISRPVVRSYGRHTFNQYVIRVANGQRDSLVQHFKADKIGFEIYYPVPLHLQEVFHELGYRRGDFPVSEAACADVLALPMYPELTFEQQRRVVQSIAGFAQLRLRRAA